MTDLRPATDETDRVGTEHEATPGISPWQKVVGAVGLVAVLWVGSDSPLYKAWFDDGSTQDMHGPGGERPGDEGPPDGMDHGPADDRPGGSGGEAPEQNGDPADPADPADGGAGHDPSQWDH